jgi:hypothetical protein
VAIKKTIWFKKITASFLLLLLFAATALKVLHFHSSGTASVTKTQIQKSGFSNYSESVSDTKCFICNYQLTKEADDCHATSYTIYPVEFANATKKYYTFTLQSINAVFETRGPPSV